MHTLPRLPMLTLALLLAPVAAGAQTLVGRGDSVYTWRGALPARATLVLRNVNGPIDVRPATGATAELRAEKRTSRGGGRTQDVAFDVRQEGNGDVTICSTFLDQNPCDEGSNRRGRNDDYRRSVTVAMTLLVPRGARIRVSTGNGTVSIERVGGAVQASTGNGRVSVRDTDGEVRVSTGNGDVEVTDARASVSVKTGNGRVNVSTAEGPVDASTGNGDIDVRMLAVAPKEDMSFSSGNGTVRVTLPAAYNGELNASTGNGELRSDFDLKVKGRLDPRHIRATIGAGGAELRLSTGSGKLEVRKQ